jgi:hypothetical protein
VAWACPLGQCDINAVLKANSDHGLGMPAARKVQSHHGYRLCLSRATVMTGPEVTGASTAESVNLNKAPSRGFY